MKVLLRLEKLININTCLDSCMNVSYIASGTMYIAEKNIKDFFIAYQCPWEFVGSRLETISIIYSLYG